MFKPWIKAFCDGGGPINNLDIACGVHVLDETDKEIIRFGKYLGKGTNNIAEYNAAIEGIKWLLFNGYKDKKCKIYMDSKLVVLQFNGKWKCKKTHLQELKKELKALSSNFTIPLEFIWIPRKRNLIPDEEATKALDDVSEINMFNSI